MFSPSRLSVKRRGVIFQKGKKNESMGVFFLAVRMALIDLFFNWTHFLSHRIVRGLFVMALKMDCPHRATASVFHRRKDRQKRQGEGGGVLDRRGSLPSSSCSFFHLLLLFLPHFQHDPHPTGFKRTPLPPPMLVPPYAAAF